MATPNSDTLPELVVSGSWEEVLRGAATAPLEKLLPAYLEQRRWFGGKARAIRSARVGGVIPIPPDAPHAYLTLVHVDYAEGSPEVYRLPLTCLAAGSPPSPQERSGALARVIVRGPGETTEGVLLDAMGTEPFLRAFFRTLCHDLRHTGAFGEVTASPTRAFRDLLASADGSLEPSVMKAEQSNTSVIYGKRFILKLYRRAEQGINPDLEIGRFLTDRSFPSIAPVASALEHRAPGGERSTVAILQRFVPNQGDAWRYTLESLRRYLAGVRARPEVLAEEPGPARPPLALAAEPVPDRVRERIGAYSDSAALLGRRTGELHLVLGQSAPDSDFAPEPMTEPYRRELVHSVERLIEANLTLLHQRRAALPSSLQGDAEKVLQGRSALLQSVGSARTHSFSSLLIRCHGDYHLGQVLYTGQDFIIIDFEGEPARPLRERRRKGSPFRDVAGMLRSFHYAAYAALMEQAAGSGADEFERLEPAARYWYTWVSATYLRTYLATAQNAPFLPSSGEELRLLLDLFLLEKAAYELGYELNNRPDWVRIPLEGLLQLMPPLDPCAPSAP